MHDKESIASQINNVTQNGVGGFYCSDTVYKGVVMLDVRNSLNLCDIIYG